MKNPYHLSAWEARSGCPAETESAWSPDSHVRHTYRLPQPRTSCPAQGQVGRAEDNLWIMEVNWLIKERLLTWQSLFIFYFFFAHVLASTKTMMVSTTMMPVIVSPKDTSFSSLGMKHKGAMITLFFFWCRIIPCNKHIAFSCKYDDAYYNQNRCYDTLYNHNSLVKQIYRAKIVYFFQFLFSSCNI